ncbi:MAG: response regulator transcription factor [Bacteroidetes bacterium]|nr:response regulator transcription factor [Bacteroidota bacterium]
MKTRILLAEDDPNLGQLVHEFLQAKGYEVTLCTDGEAAAEAFIRGDYHLCVLDVMMPKLDGFSLIKKLQAHNPNIPVIYTTALGKLQDKTKGFKLGADDYLPKPFSIEELILRIEAVLKRVKEAPAVINNTGSEDYQLGKLVFNYTRRTIRGGQEERKLSSKESELLRLLCRQPGRLLEREVALTAVWGKSNYYTSRSMDVYITKLRKYLREDPNVEIVNVHGEGYKLMLH